MVQYCVAYNCKTKAGEGYAFFKFPEDPWLRTKWCLALQRKNFIPSKYSKICSKHFLIDDIGENRNGFPCLEKGAVPRIFDFLSIPGPKNKRLQKRKMEFSDSGFSVVSSLLDKESSNAKVSEGILENKKLKTSCEKHSTHIPYADLFSDSSTCWNDEVNDISTEDLKVKKQQGRFSDNSSDGSGDLSDTLTAGIKEKQESEQELDRFSDNSTDWNDDVKDTLIAGVKVKQESEQDWFSDNSTDWNDDVNISTAKIKVKQDVNDTSKTTNFPVIIKIERPTL